MQTHNRSQDDGSSLPVEVNTLPEIINVGFISEHLDNNLENLDFNDICELGREAMDLRKFTNIVIGKLALEVESRYGENSLGEFAKEVGLRKNTVNQYRWVAAHFPELKTYGDLSYTYYRIASGTEDPQGWIQQAVDNNWNVTQLQMKIDGKQLRHECKHEQIEKIVIDKCVDCRTILARQIVS